MKKNIRNKKNNNIKEKFSERIIHFRPQNYKQEEGQCLV